MENKIIPIAEIIGRMQTDSHRTTAKPVRSYDQETVQERDRWNRLDGFETCGDLVLKKMRATVVRYLQHLHELSPRKRPQGDWLSMLGNNGVGKTMLAQKIYDAWRSQLSHYVDPGLGIVQHRPGRFVKWSTWLRSLPREGLGAKINELVRCPFLVLDEVGAARDKSGFVADLLHEILSDRMGYPTVITSNITLEGWQEIDARIASRMVRNRNQVILCTTTDYALRHDRTA